MSPVLRREVLEPWVPTPVAIVRNVLLGMAIALVCRSTALLAEAALPDPPARSAIEEFR